MAYVTFLEGISTFNHFNNLIKSNNSKIEEKKIYECLPTEKIYKRINNKSPSCYNGKYPKTLLQPEKENKQFYDKVNVETTSTLWQLDSKQDFVWQGCDSQGNAIAILFDGHGSNYCLNIIKNLQIKYLIKLFEDETMDPITALETYTDISSLYSVNSGGCIVMCKIKPNKVELWSVGDSKGVIYKNNKLVKQTKEHDENYPGEIERLIKEKQTTLDKVTTTHKSLVLVNHGLKPSAPDYYNKVTHIEKLRFKFDPENKFNELTNDYAMSRSVGHCGLTSKIGENIEYVFIDYNDEDDIYVILASDGLWDVQEPDNDLLNYAKKGAYNTILVACNKWYEDKKWVHSWTHNCLKCKNRREAHFKKYKTYENDKIDESVTTLFTDGIRSDDIGIIVLNKKFKEKKPIINLMDSKETENAKTENAKTENAKIKEKYEKIYRLKKKSLWSNINKKDLHRRINEWKYCESNTCSEIIHSQNQYCEWCEIENEMYN